MPTTSSPTSAKPSTAASNWAVAAWAGVAFVLIALAFAGTSGGAGVDEDILYDYGFAFGSLIVYGILVGVTLAISALLGEPLPAVGIKRFAWRWIWIALGLILLVLGLASALEPVLHAGEEQGFQPDTWQPDRAGAFALNAVVAATVVPFGEELFFRGLGVRVLLPFGALTAVVVTALAFGLGHGLFSALPVLVPFALALGWVRLRSDSVWPGVIAHGFYNGTALLFLYLDLTNRV